MVTETNRYADQFRRSHQLLPHARSQQWQPVTVTEMKTFVAILLEMGITWRPNIFSYLADILVTFYGLGICFQDTDFSYF
jgi:hypothetical protein